MNNIVEKNAILLAFHHASAAHFHRNRYITKMGTAFGAREPLRMLAVTLHQDRTPSPQSAAQEVEE